MKLSCRALAALVLCLASAIASGQRARSTRVDPRSFVAPRYLYELRDAPINDGARVTGDVDGDGDLDLLMLEQPNVVQSPRGLQIWLNGGRGDFHEAGLLSFAGFSTGPGFHAGSFDLLADVTGDGRLDVVYERVGPGVVPPAVVVHPGLGDGSFAAPLTFQTEFGVSGLDVGDCDGDGDADLLVHEASSFGIHTLAWWSLQGGAFVSGPEFGEGGRGLLIAAFDADGDGISDAAATNVAGDTLRILRTVNGELTLVASFPLPSELSTDRARLLTGDLDGDGDEDVLETMYHFDNDSLPPYNVDVFYFQPVRNDGAGFTALPLQSIPQPVGAAYLAHNDGALADWDEDGDADYVSPNLTWMENDGAGSFALAARQPSQADTSGGTCALQVVDLNGDGHLDALASWTCYFGDGSFPVRGSIGDAYQFPPWRVLEDREGDGDLDLVGSSVLYLNNGDGSFTGGNTPVPRPAQGAPFEIGWGDFDGDGFRDLVLAFIDYPFEFLGMFLITGTENGGYLVSSTEPSPILMTVPDASLAGDVDGDGDNDILTRDGFWQNDGSGRFGTVRVAAYSGRPLLARDLDADADLDLLVEDGGLKVLTNLGALSFVTANLGAYATGSLPSFLDADQDGDLDLVNADPTNEVLRVYERLPGGGFAAPFVLAAPAVNGRVAQFDLDGDGRLDLAAGLGDADPHHRLAVWIRAQGLSFSARREWMTPDLPIAFGDLDRDGDVEPIGRMPFWNYEFDGPEDGQAVQYGLQGGPGGTGGRHPVFGSGGPVRPGHSLELVVGGGRGGASGVLMRGEARTDLPSDVLVGGYWNLIAEPSIVRSFVLGGAPGAAGAGSIVLRTPVTSALVGRTFDYQVVLVDPGANSGLVGTNGLEIRYGDWPLTR